MGDGLIRDGRGGGYEDFAGSRRETVDELGVLAFHVTQSSGVGNLPGAMILFTGEGLAVLADVPSTVEGLLGMTIVLSEKGPRGEEKCGYK